MQNQKQGAMGAMAGINSNVMGADNAMNMNKGMVMPGNAVNPVNANMPI